MALAEDIEAAQCFQDDKKITDPNSVAAVSKRNAALKSVEAQGRRLTESLNAAVQESQSIEGFFKEKVSEQDQEAEPWKGLYDKLRAAVDKAPTEVKAAQEDIDIVTADVSAKERDFNEDALKESLKKINDKHAKAADCHLAVHRRALVEMKAALSKLDASKQQKKRKLQSGQGGVDGAQKADARQEELVRSLEVVKAEVSASPRNVLASFENAGEGKAVAVTCKEMVDAMSSAPGYDTLEKWTQRKVKDSLAEPAYGSVTSPAITAAMRHHCGLLRPDGLLFRQLFLPKTPKEQGLQKSVYGVQLFVAPAGHIACSPAPFGVSECRVVIEGSELIIAVRASATVGLVEQMNSLKEMSAQELLSEFAKEPTTTTTKTTTSSDGG
eukprot:3872303-Pyramimonas_sp.AAC.1